GERLLDGEDRDGLEPGNARVAARRDDGGDRLDAVDHLAAGRAVARAHAGDEGLEAPAVAGHGADADDVHGLHAVSSTSLVSAATQRSAIARTSSSVSTPRGHDQVACTSDPDGPSSVTALISIGRDSGMRGSAPPPMAAASGAGRQPEPPSS